MIQYLFNKKSYFIKLIFIYNLVSIVIVLGNSCQDNPHPSRIPTETTETAWFDPEEDISFNSQPRWLRMFHINPEVGFGNQPVLLTWYERPYEGSFNFVLISESGTLEIYSESPTWARRGGISPVQLKSKEHQKINEYLETFSDVKMPTTSHDVVVIVLSFENTKSKRQMITCTQSTCPIEVREIFEIVYETFQREHDYNLLLPMPFIDE